jgi:TolB-like protein/DNA-binding winged helix-turn-helix (wHTH) protein
VLRSGDWGCRMVSPTFLTKTARFGVFELDCQTGELRKQGVRLRLQGQPIEVLKRLLETPGELVTREELRKRLWPADTFVDFDQALNNSIQRIRETLGDSAQSPRFIETIPKRGYRFVGDVPSPDLETAKLTTESGSWQRSMRWALAAAVILIGIGGTWSVWRWRENRRLEKIRAIAVLPLENLSGDPSQEYFADGMTDELITQLAQIKSLRVISRTSVMQYKQIRKPLPEIARALEVDAIVEGSVARSGNNIRITGQLIDARSDRHVWAQDFAVKTEDVLTLQRQVARAITQAVSLNTAEVQQSNLSSATQVNPQAYDDYLKCRYFWARRTAVDLQRSVQSCEQAVARDPNFAQAWAQLADSYLTLPVYADKQPIGALRRAKAAADRAVALDNGLADGHTALGLLNEEAWKWQEAGFEYETAIRLNPNSARAHQLYASYLSAMGRHEESLRHMLLAQQLDPISLIIRTNVGYVLGRARRFENAAAACGKVLELDAGFVPAHLCLSWDYEYLGKYKEAIAEDKKVLSLAGGPPAIFKTAALAHAYAVSGEHLLAREIVSRMESQSHEDLEPYEIACIHAALGNRDRAIKFLNMAYVYHDGQLELMATDPDLDSLRADPRFQQLLAKIGVTAEIH